MPKVSPIEPSPEALSSRRSQKFSLGFLRRWWVVSFVLLGCGVGSGSLGAWLLLRQPPTPTCNQVFWPFASASLRLYCAQEWAQKQTLEDLFQAIALVDSLPQSHPLRPLINRWVEIWSKQALDLAEVEFDQGDLERAIYFAKKIPAQTTVHTLVDQRIQYWQTVWAKGEGIFKRTETAFKQEDWRKAFAIMVELLSVDNRYWAETQYEAINQRIIQAQKDETQLVQAQRFFKAGGLDNLTKALELVQELSEGNIFQKSVQTTVNQISRALVNLAETALGQEDINTALDALQQIPQQVSFWPEVQDWLELANAMSDTWSGDVEGHETAIAQLQKIAPNRPLYGKAQDFIVKWSADIAYVRILATAQTQADSGSIQGLASAIAQARDIPSDSSQWSAAQQSISNWTSELSAQQDQPILSRADELSFRGDPHSLRAAIQAAQQISAESPRYTEAQSRIQDWQSQLQQHSVRDLPPPSLASSAGSSVDRESSPDRESSVDRESSQLFQEAQLLAQQGTPKALASAMETANQVSAQSPVRADAQQAINAWSNQLLELARRLANSNPAEAIALAQQIPAFSAAYADAQTQIQSWQTVQP